MFAGNYRISLTSRNLSFCTIDLEKDDFYVGRLDGQQLKELINFLQQALEEDGNE